MEAGIHSYEQRSSNDSFLGAAENKTRIIIVDRRCSAAAAAPANVNSAASQSGGAGQKSPPLSFSKSKSKSARNSERQPPEPPLEFASNELTSSKYTMLNFLPRNLFEQFRRFANFYFLVTALMQIFIPFSPVGPTTSLVPLVFVVSTTAIKQGYEDYLRHKRDKEVNNRPCHVLRRNGKLSKVRSKDIKVGDFVFVRNNEEIPCDMILLTSSSPTNDRCYVTTTNLDGETSLKSRTCFNIKEQIGSLQVLDDSLLIVECEKPNATLYEFCGYIRAPRDFASYRHIVAQLKANGKLASVSMLATASKVSKSLARVEKSSSNSESNDKVKMTTLASAAALASASVANFSEIPLDTSNLLLRASRLRNTSFIYGLAIYTGKDTKVAHNSQLKPNKFSSTETTVNKFLLIAFGLLASFSLIAALRHKVQNLWYLDGLETPNKFRDILLAHFLLFNYLVPISLYVTLEFVKFIGSKSVTSDRKMRAYTWKTQAGSTISSPPSKSKSKSKSNLQLKTKQTQTEERPASDKDGSEQAKASKQQTSEKKYSHERGSASSLSSGQRKVKIIDGPKCNTSDLNEELGQIQVLFTDKTGTLTENKMVFKACSASSKLYRVIDEKLYLHHSDLVRATAPPMSKTLTKVVTNRHAYLANSTTLRNQTAATLPAGATLRERRAAVEANAQTANQRLPQPPPPPPPTAGQRQFDHRVVPPSGEVKLVDDMSKNEQLVNFFLCVCLCSTAAINESVPLEQCLPDKCNNDYDFQSASPDEESFISAAHKFGVTLIKSNDFESVVCIRRTGGSNKTLIADRAKGQPANDKQQSLFAEANLKENSDKENPSKHHKHKHHNNNNNNNNKRPPPSSIDDFVAIVETKASTDAYIVRHFKRMTVFEFNSSRKRMSVIYKDMDTGKFLIVSKGSELILDCVKVKHMAPFEEQAFNVTLAHFEAFAKSGLRTMLVARRTLGAAEYAKIMDESKEARLSVNNREQLLSVLYQRAESDLTLIGATAVEDSLQRGVPETIANLKSAGIKVWLLTGDKVETAVSVAYLCKLLESDMVLFHLVLQKDLQSCRKLLVSYRQQIQAMKAALKFELRKTNGQTSGAHSFESTINRANINNNNDDTLVPISSSTSVPSHRPAEANSLRSFSESLRPVRVNQSFVSQCLTWLWTKLSLIVKHFVNCIKPTYNNYSDNFNIEQELSTTTTTSMASKRRHKFALIADGRSLYYAMKYSKADLARLCESCTCVLGCRLSPIQKAEVVDMMKTSRGSPITAAIGDGANDVSMIQEAHVGIGIKGKEGKQAVNSSDFAINRFRMLNRLLFVHGHYFYHRTANVVHYFFYKNICFVLPQFLYSFYNNSSGLSLYHAVFLITFNLLFTSLPIIVYGVHEVHIPEVLLENFPKLYTLNRANKKMKLANFVVWLLLGAMQAAIIFYLLVFNFGSHSPLLDSGKMAGINGVSIVLFFSVVAVTSFTLYALSNYHSTQFNSAIGCSVFLMPLIFYIYSKFNSNFIIRDNSLYGQFEVYYKAVIFWLALLSTTLAAILPELVMTLVRQVRLHAHLRELVAAL